MNRQEFVKIIAPISEYYAGKPMADAAIEVYFDLAKSLPADIFDHLIRFHMTDPDQGRFFPTMAHVMAQAGTESDAKAQAGIEFDRNTGIDGTSSFDRKQESMSAKASRRNAYIARSVAEWRESDPVSRIINSARIPEQMKNAYITYSAKGVCHG